MAVTSITFAAVGGAVPVIAMDSAVTDILTPSGSNQTSTQAASATRTICRIATDSALYVSFGTAPNATSDASRVYVPAGATEFFGVASGNKAAIVLA